MDPLEKVVKLLVGTGAFGIGLLGLISMGLYWLGLPSWGDLSGASTLSQSLQFAALVVVELIGVFFLIQVVRSWHPTIRHEPNGNAHS